MLNQTVDICAAAAQNYKAYALLAVLLMLPYTALGQMTQPDAESFIQFQAKRNELDKKSKPITGRASVIDGDTIEIQGQRIRLWGVDAPESDQLCRGQGGNHYQCGQVASNRLDAFIAHRSVDCVEVDVDRFRRAVAVCTVAGVDLADWLVKNGLALD
jgi:endonuclease YncB( thermonuclease family)